jgi:N-carbamoyl-L-amino-acid hydrolase
VLDRLHAELQRLVAEANQAGPCPIEIDIMSQSTPALMDEGFQAAIEAAAQARCPGKALRMPSGAGHDAQYLARVMPAAMLFVPSIGGISHHWTENTSDEDIVLGCQVFCDALAGILRAQPADQAS